MTKALREARPPETVTQLRSFLEAANVYRKFVKNFAMVASPLYKLLKDLPENCGRRSKHPVAFNEDAANAFPPVLALPVADRRFSIDTDASPEQIGAALLQEDEGGQHRPIGFWS